MGAAYSSGRAPVGRSSKPSRHAWSRIQDLDYESAEEEDEEDRWWEGDRRVQGVDEVSDWPRSCPVMHLNIQKDFPLLAQQRFIRSNYRFWLFSWWVSVVNFIGIMSSLLTSNVTNPGSMTMSFVSSVIYLFAVFFMYFRVIYWAVRLESNVLFIWYYIASVAIIAFFVYQVTQALGLVSILAAPLAPGSELPVKVNPIFPVILFTLVVLMYLLSLVFAIYHLSAAVKWQKMSDKQKMKLFKQQNKKGWLSAFQGSKDNADLEDDDPSSDKPKYSYSCVLTYEKTPDEENPQAKKGKRKGRSRRREKLTIPGKIGVYPNTREIKFTAKEAIFSNVFTLSVLFININKVSQEGDTLLEIAEKLNEGVEEEDRKAFKHLTATCNTPERTERILQFNFETKNDCTTCNKNVNKLWQAIKKKEELFISDDHDMLRQRRVEASAKHRSRAAQHLLTHKDWKLLVGCVWRQTFRAGDVILDKGAHISEIMHITDGTVAMFLETTESASEKMKAKELEMEEGDDIDLHAMLFPEQMQGGTDRAPSLETLQVHSTSRFKPRYFTVRFTNHKLGYSSRKTTRAYNLEQFLEEDAANGEFPKRVFPNNQAIIVYKVKSGSEAEKVGVKVGDELVKVGLYDVEANNLTQKSVKNLVKNHSFPMTMEFRRPPDLSMEENDRGFVDPNPNFVPEAVRANMKHYSSQANLRGSEEPPELVLHSTGLLHQPVSEGHEEESGLLESQHHEYPTSEEEEEEEEILDEEDHPLAGSQAGSQAGGGGRSVAGNSTYSMKQQTTSSLTQSDPLDPSAPLAPPGAVPGWSSQPEPDLLNFGNDKKDEKKDQMDGLSALDLAEAFASQSAQQSQQPAPFHASAPASVREEIVEFEPSAPTIEDLAREHASKKQDSEPETPDEFSEEELRNRSMTARVLATGRRFLFGKEIEYRKIQEESMRTSLGAGPDKRVMPHDFSIVVDGDSDASSAGEPPYSEVGLEDDVNDPDAAFSDMFASIQTFEPVGKYKKGDSLGIIPWILNQPISVMQLRAETDVVMHSIRVKDLSNLFRKNGTLALAFFKYVAAVVGERADRDEEKLVDQIEEELFNRDSSDGGTHRQLRRLLDDKPIHTAEKTMFEKRSEDLDKARRYFEQDFDMAFDSIIDQVNCQLQIVGDITVVVAQQWKGIGQVDRNVAQEGVLYITHYHLCFRTFKRTMDLTKLRRRPTFYGKVHLNDIYEMSRYGNSGETLVIKTDDLRLEISFTDPRNAAMVEDWVHALLRTGTIVERAPHSYTLPGDLYGLSSGTQDSNLPASVAADPLNIVYSQQHDLRTEFLILTQTLQQVLTNQDRYKIFSGGSSVTLRRNQSVLVASLVSHSEEKGSDIDPNQGRRTTASKKSLARDGPNGLYLVGSGELVVQREVNGRRIQFASYKVGTVFGVERFLTGAPSPFTIKVASERAVLKFAPRDRCMALLRADLALAARFYQYCALLQLQRLRGPIISRPLDESDVDVVAMPVRGSKGCTIL